MPTRSPTPPPDIKDPDADAPIEVYFGNLTLDFGMGTVPKLLLRFGRYLRCDGECLTNNDMLVLVNVLALREADDAGYELRMSNLPIEGKKRTRERYKAKLREMGVVFTRRIYYRSQNKNHPDLKAQQWDMRSLFYNLERVGRLWLERQKKLVMQWELNGARGLRPVYEFPPEFYLEVELPTEVVASLLEIKTVYGREKSVIYPLPEKWLARAQMAARAIVSNLSAKNDTYGKTPEKQSENALSDQPTPLPIQPTAVSAKNGTYSAPPKKQSKNALSGEPAAVPAKSGTYRAQYLPKMARHLIKSFKEEEEEAAPDFSKLVLTYLFEHGGVASEKDLKTLNKLITRGCALPHIQAAIDEAAARQAAGKIRVFNLAYCATIALNSTRPLEVGQSENGKAVRPSPIRDTAVSPSPNVNVLEANAPSVSRSVTTPELISAIQACEAAGYVLRVAQCARLQMLADEFDAHAQRAGATGAQWLARALRESIGAARENGDRGNIAAYAANKVKAWIEQGGPDVVAAQLKTNGASAPRVKSNAVRQSQQQRNQAAVERALAEPEN